MTQSKQQKGEDNLRKIRQRTKRQNFPPGIHFGKNVHVMPNAESQFVRTATTVIRHNLCTCAPFRLHRILSIAFRSFSLFFGPHTPFFFPRGKGQVLLHCKPSFPPPHAPSVWTECTKSEGTEALLSKHFQRNCAHEQREGMDTRHGKEELTLKEISKHFNTPIQEAAKALGVCPTILKKICRRLGIGRWPYRRVNSLNKMIATLETAYQRQQEQAADGSPPRAGTRGSENIRREIEALKRERDLAMAGNAEVCKDESTEHANGGTEQQRGLPLHKVLLPKENMHIETSPPQPKKKRLHPPPVETKTPPPTTQEDCSSSQSRTNPALPIASPPPMSPATEEFQPQHDCPLPAKWHHELTDPSTGSTKTVVLLPPLETIL